jgi:NAD-dependent dihydropyrimidine dehydrogenase PreA subunit
MAMFIRVDIDDSVQQDAELCARLVEVCPVDIFEAPSGGGVATVDANLDECTLCDLCLDAASDKVRVVKLYEE